MDKESSGHRVEHGRHDEAVFWARTLTEAVEKIVSAISYPSTKVVMWLCVVGVVSFVLGYIAGFFSAVGVFHFSGKL